MAWTNWVSMKILSGAQMREMDRHTIETVGIPSLELMERAGRVVADFVLERFPSASRILVACGRGNNGGDGWVVARRLADAGKDVFVSALEKREDCSPDCQEMWRRSDIEPSREYHPNPDLVVDAIYGTGFDASRSGDLDDRVTGMSKADARIVAVDIPSGLDATTGKIGAAAVRATATVTFQNPKLGFFQAAGPDHVGEVYVRDIGLVPAEEHADAPEFLLDPRMPSLPRTAHKGTRGHVLCVGGSTSMPGSIALTAIAALRAGAGLATCAVPETIQPIVAGYHPEVMTIPLPDGGTGRLTEAGANKVLEVLPKYSVMALGPGLTAEPETQKAVELLLRQSVIPIVLDADGLNCLANIGPIAIQEDLILTPHPGEMGRLMNVPTEKVLENRLEIAKACAMKYNATVVLKGMYSLIAHPNRPTIVNSTGGNRLGTAGSGDVLTGVIAAMHNEPATAVYLHGLAGQQATAYLTATDLSKRISALRGRLEHDH